MRDNNHHGDGLKRPIPHTPADTLREAAQLMRRRAEAATPGPWMDTADGDAFAGPRLITGTGYGDGDRRAVADAEHIAGWHPAVALAVADWVDASVPYSARGAIRPEALAVARAYLGEVPE